MLKGFVIKFLLHGIVVAEVSGRDDYKAHESMTRRELFDGVLETEQFLEKLTGYRVHIEEKP
jgi:hypothetical protein